MAPRDPTVSSMEGEHRPTVADLEGDNHWALLARKHWLKGSKSKKVKPEVIKSELWDTLEAESFDFRSVLLLENLHLLENYLWPGYTEDASNYHVLLVALLVAVKSRENLPVWDVFSDRPSDFSSLFRRILSMSLDTSLSVTIRTHLLSFIVNAFQSLDNGLVRKECAPLVSISIWHNLASDAARETKFGEHGQLRKAWRAAAKRYDAADETSQARLRFERSWLYSMILDFVKRLYEPTQTNLGDLIYCERFLELLIDLDSQLPTRRYVNSLLEDLNLLSLIKLSTLFNDEENGLLRDLYGLLRHFMYFSIDDHTGAQYSRTQSYEAHCAKLARLQRTALKHFKSKLTILALSNYGTVEQRTDLENHLEALSDAELSELCTLLGYRTSYPPSTKIAVDRTFVMEVLVSGHEIRKTFQEVVKDLNIMPTESTLYEPALLRNETYDGSRSLAIPKLNLQYLTVGDFLWRSFVLYRCESFFEIRKDIEDTIKRMQVRSVGSGSTTQFEGFSRMAIPISKISVLEVVPARVGHAEPSLVRAEIALDTSSLAENIRREWESLRPDDVIYLLAVQQPEDTKMTNGHSAFLSAGEGGLLHLRAAEIMQLLDENGRAMRDISAGVVNGHSHRPQLRKIILKLDAAAYKLDSDRQAIGKPNIYEAINVVVRRKGRENNFKRILESIRSLTLSDVPVPSWFQEVFLGYGDPSGASYARLANRLKAIDFRDTFLNWQHLVDSLPGKTVEPDGKEDSSFDPPYILEIPIDTATTAPRPSKKRRLDHMDSVPAPQESVRVSTYCPPKTGPYPVDAPKLNQIRFTPVQVEAIVSGTQPGLTVIVGPPGTGKTDVATQIINNLYHDFPTQRILLVAHSNQALNQLFQKIVKLDIDERHLLRLGHGEGDLETEASFGKQGRVESFLDNRGRFLAEVDRLAANFDAPGAHGNSCETAGYFKLVYVSPAWSNFWEATHTPEITTSEIISAFPFHRYFSNAPQPLFPPDCSKDDVIDIAKGCQYHIERIFAELEDIRPFEILRTSKDKANYLLIKEARIVAMTSTHAAMRRQEIADLGFHYDNVIMEEAAQITEIENFIPLALQKPKDGELPLQRIVLCGDHLQNSPIVQNLAFQQYANLEQSLFLRLVRLGVPTINLDQQGRARPSMAELYKWRYPRLGNLSNVETGPEFRQANAGFRYDYQFINVPDYKGRGEMQPSPHFIQNLGEAEYAVAIYQYMRLLGYAASKISILTTYAGQRSLIRDVLSHRCARNRLFGLPRIVTTVDKYQGEQNEYVILSLTRTNRVGYLRDIRRLTVALSRARLGLYILGRREVFETCYELKEAFDRLLRRPDALMLVHGEVFPTTRLVDDEVEATEMAGLEHLGQYVYEMTQAKIKALQGGQEVFPPVVEDVDMDGDEADENGVTEQPEELDE
ncbi:dead helicases superfamily protein [Lasallia pustulata]|uniref:Pre-mRNA-splicing factor n=1 Tax=Lasallia pustulata TaxID=136370 RepID=A0A1W5CXU5_9LECA|nr:dead helicases superfamily protein [Lasallia pustulata]